jgi:NAD(P)-dependent dehydrogenase (short-subunit alcohol dehydrogenase family)
MTKVVLITGASSGIGRLTAELMARHGWQVVATARDAKALEALVGQPGISAIQLDVTDDASIASAIKQTVERFGGVDVLVNNAGYGHYGPLEGTSAEEVELQFRTNVFGTINCIRHVMPVMRAKRSGTIINLSSVGGRTATPFLSLYHASKFAIEGFSESFRYEAALHGVRIKVVEPGHFKTNFLGRSLRRSSHSEYEKQLDNYSLWVNDDDRKAPTPEPVAEAILRAAEDSSNKLRYPVNGAFVIGMTTLLPDSWCRAMLAAGLTRRPRIKAAANA